MSKPQVADLKGAQLDFEVGLAQGMLGLTCTTTECFARKDATSRLEPYSPSTDWAQGGPIIDASGISLIKDDERLLYRAGGNVRLEILTFNDGEGHYDTEASIEMSCEQSGKTALIAAMRCYVEMKFGPEVSE